MKASCAAAAVAELVLVVGAVVGVGSLSPYPCKGELSKERNSHTALQHGIAVLGYLSDYVDRIGGVVTGSELCPTVRPSIPCDQVNRQVVFPLAIVFTQVEAVDADEPIRRRSDHTDDGQHGIPVFHRDDHCLGSGRINWAAGLDHFVNVR